MKHHNKEALGFVSHVHLPYLDYLVQEKGLLDVSMWMKVVCQALKVSFPNALLIKKCSKLMKEYFESKGDAGKCQLLLCLLKSNCLVVVRIFLGIKMVRSSEGTNHIVRNLQSDFNVIGKTSHNKYLCVTRRVLSESVVSKSTWKRCLLSHTSHILKLNRKIV